MRVISTEDHVGEAAGPSNTEIFKKLTLRYHKNHPNKSANVVATAPWLIIYNMDILVVYYECRSMIIKELAKS